jgi:hypothetical protein
MTKKKGECEGAEEQVESGSSFFDAAGSCGPMIERMMKAFSESAGEGEGSSATATGSGRRASCAAMMQRMMETCGRSRTAEDRSQADAEEDHPGC